jgi:hypothetical protein
VLPLVRATVAVLLALSLSGCGPDRLEKTERDIAKAVTEAVARGDTATLWFFIEVPFAYERMYIAAPRTSPEEIRAAFNSAVWIPEMSRGIESADHFHLLLFETRGQLIPAALLRKVADIDSALTGRIYGPNEARFSVRPGSNGMPPKLTALP